MTKIGKILTSIFLLSSVIFIFIHPASAQPKIYYGQTVFGSISKGEKNEFRFEGAKGDVVTLRFGKTSGNLNPHLELYDSSGAFIDAASVSNDYPNYGRLNKTLTASGVFKIVIRDENNLDAGSYALSLQKVNYPGGRLKYPESTEGINPSVNFQKELTLLHPESLSLQAEDERQIKFESTVKSSPLGQGVTKFTTQAAINCGETVTGSITTAGQKDTYTFTASANDRVTIRLGEISGDLYLELRAPDGSLLAGIDYGRIDRTLTTSGTYTLVARGYYSSSTGNYALTWQKLNSPCNALAINCGQITSGSIATSGETDFYTFTASSNDKVTIRIGEISSDLYLELYDSTGVRLSGIDSGRIDTTLSQGGTYTLIVRGYNATNTGNYTLVWQKLNNPCNATVINCGQAVSSSISTSGETDFYAFAASANDKITIPLVEISGDLYLELYSPDGVRLAGIDYGSINTTLPLDGTYTLIVRGYYSSSTGNYGLAWQKLNNPCNTTVINCGQVVSGSITSTELVKYYSFSASANDKVTVRMAEVSGDLYLELYSPAGVRLAGIDSGRIDTALPVSGAYTLVVKGYYGDSTGNYTLVWQKLNNPCNTTIINCGQVIANSIANPGEYDFYSFTASANDKVTTRLAQISGDLYLELYSPEGTRLATIDSGSINATLPIDGTYTVIVRSYYSSGTGDYAILWQKLNNPCNTTTISYGDRVSGAISEPVQINAYNFTASLNEMITICTSVDSTTSGSFGIYLELYDNSGNPLTSSSGSLKHTFVSAGTFYLFVKDYYADGTGTYKMALLKGDISCSNIDDIDLVAPLVSLIQPQGGEIIEGGSAYAITWTSSDNVGIVSQEVRLSTDSGLTYPTVIASNLPASAKSYNWLVPADLSTTKCRIKVSAVDPSNNLGEDQSISDFIVIKTALPAEAKDTIYSYDTLNRLIAASYSDGRGNIYTYDSLGNRLSLNSSGLPEEWRLILPVPWYQEVRNYYSAAASCKMVLDYIRQNTTLTQDEIYNYVATGSRELNPQDVEKALNHFKPIPYNFGIIAKSDITEAMRDIVHWMDYEVPNTPISNTPVVIPTFGRYDNWMVVRGAAASLDPNANQNPWQTAIFTVYGFWLNDPATGGIGENSYKTAAELQNTYYLPVSTNDAWFGKFVGVAEPPKVLSQAQVRIAEAYSTKSNPQLSVLLQDEQIASRSLNQFNWIDIIDPHLLLTDADFNAALKNTMVRTPIKVNRLDSEGASYYLIPFDKFMQGKYLTSVVLIVDAANSSFKEASWVESPTKYQQLTKEEAIAQVQRTAFPGLGNDKGNIILKKITAQLVWEPGAISTSPYRPFWRVSLGNKVWFVTDDGRVISSDVTAPDLLNPAG